MPNVFLALGHRPAELRAFCDYHDALMERESGLSKAERELEVVATSAANKCTYCIVAHGAFLRILAKDDQLADLVAANPWGAPLGARQRAIADLALSLAQDSARFGERELAAACDAGLSNDENWDGGAITAFFAMSNRLAHLMTLRPNDEFFGDGARPAGEVIPVVPGSSSAPAPHPLPGPPAAYLPRRTVFMPKYTSRLQVANATRSLSLHGISNSNGGDRFITNKARLDARE